MHYLEIPNTVYSMKKKIDIVIGMNYGDEGKGLVTDYLVSRSYTSCAVVRFNGGAQAGHTVELSDGRRHVFHHFGSGSFCGCPTILSSFFVVNPVLFFIEAETLYHTLYPTLKLPLKIYVDPTCSVTTPYDVYINQSLENNRGDSRHGSCGVGFGETLARTESGFTLTVADIVNGNLISKLSDIRDNYFPQRLKDLGLPVITDLPDDTFEVFVETARNFADIIYIIEDTFSSLSRFDHLIFEGAQGLRLDQDGKDFPYVTRSNTGLKNVSSMIHNIEADINLYYLTRTYLTRHGAGPLKNEYSLPLGINDKTNIPNDFQGTLRFAPLDFEEMGACVVHDKLFLKDLVYKTIAVVTCCDQINKNSVSPIISSVKNAIGADYSITSWGPTRNTIVLQK